MKGVCPVKPPNPFRAFTDPQTTMFPFWRRAARMSGPNSADAGSLSNPVTPSITKAFWASDSAIRLVLSDFVERKPGSLFQVSESFRDVEVFHVLFLYQTVFVFYDLTFREKMTINFCKKQKHGDENGELF